MIFVLGPFCISWGSERERSDRLTLAFGPVRVYRRSIGRSAPVLIRQQASFDYQGQSTKRKEQCANLWNLYSKTFVTAFAD